MKNPPTRDDRETAEYLQRRWHRNDTTSIHTGAGREGLLLAGGWRLQGDDCRSRAAATGGLTLVKHSAQVLVYLITLGARLSQFLAQILPSHFPAAVASHLRGKSALLGKLDSM
jgi:hypothetical protein